MPLFFPLSQPHYIATISGDSHSLDTLLTIQQRLLVSQSGRLASHPFVLPIWHGYNLVLSGLKGQGSLFSALGQHTCLF